VSDVHLHGGIHPSARRTLEVLDRERPEVVVLTGDICERPRDVEDLVAFSREARGSTATFAIWGNWEADSGLTRPDLAKAYDRSEVQFLCNQAGLVTWRGERLTVVGLDDLLYGRPDPGEALRSAPALATTVWLVHEPGYVATLPADRLLAPAMILAGHTHGGQVRLPLIPPILPRGSGPFLEGWYRNYLAPLYVSRGIGTATIRARFLCPPELPILTLRRGVGE
jgi:predicted MPP superfamily phosphohydrolase